MTTPMRRQYLALKSQHPDCILFFRLGDFYETFDDDARIVAEICDVALTSRPVGNNQRVPLAGVPYHSAEGYIAKLIEAGRKVAIAEQVSEPGNGLVEREVQQVVTRGTVTEPSMLQDKRNNYLVAVTFNAEGTGAGIAYCDITTGEFGATQLAGDTQQETERRVGEELSRLQPSELVAADWTVAESGLGALIASLGVQISSVEPWQVEMSTAHESLKRHFQVSTLDGFGLQPGTQPVRAAAAILAYLSETQPSVLDLLVNVHSYTIGEFMTLDEFTRRNLELAETIRGGQTQGSLLGVLDETLTPMGGRLLRRWMGQPLLRVETIVERLDAVEAFYNGTAARMESRDALRGLGDLERWSNRILQGRGLPRDVMGIRAVLRQIPDIRATIQGGLLGQDAGNTAARDLLSRLPPCSEILAHLENAISEEPPATLGNPGIIRRGYSQELDDIVYKSQHAKEWVTQLEKTERERLDIKSLKVGYNKVFGYYIEITHTHKDKVPDEYIRKQTLTNSERYITPELKEYESLILNADERRLEMEQRLFQDVTAEIRDHVGELLTLAAGLARLDVFSTLAEVALKRRYTRPEINDDADLVIADGRHPVVELTGDDPFVPNDTHLTPDGCIHILTGPNMSGKCVSGDTLIFTDEGLFPIADLMPAGAQLEEFTELGCRVQGPDSSRMATHFYRGGQQPTVKVTTRLGYELEGTPEHRVWVRSPDGCEGWKVLGEVDEGDVVAIQRQVDLWGKTVKIDAAAAGVKDAKKYPLPNHLDEDLAYVMGLLVGDGTLTYRNMVTLSTADSFVAEEFGRIIARHFGCQVGCKSNGTDYFITSVQIRLFLANLGLGYHQAHEKHVPSSILRAPRHIVVAFLQGLFDAGGYTDRRYGNVFLSTASARLAREVHMLLLNLGMMASLRAEKTTHRPSYVLSIYGEDAIRFHRAAGFRLPRKRKWQELASTVRRPNAGGIPYLGEALKQEQAQIVATDGKPVALKHNGSINSIFYTYLPDGRNISYDKPDELVAYCGQSAVATPELASLQKRRYFYDPIVTIESGEAEVYDLSVAEDHAYIANGLVSHNSTYLRQTALITLMAQIGSFVPAKRARIGVVDRIFTRIGASDEIHRGQSTFMVEMVETANILNHATDRSLLVLDEIGRGTSTYDGLAIAWAVIEYIHSHPGLRAKTLFATHYHELTDLAERLPHVVNYHVAVDDSGDGRGDDVIFLHQILPGKTDRSYGVHVADMAGLPTAVVDRAAEILADLERSGAAGPRRITELGDDAPRSKRHAVQVGLFAELHPAVEALRKLDVNSLSPLDALNHLYELQQMLKNEEPTA